MSKLFNQAEYIWLDGAKPTHDLRSKTRVLDLGDPDSITLEDFPEWGFDGSSTNQATGDNSDCALKPVCFVKDPIKGEGNYLVLCEVLNADGSEHESNTRAKLRKVLAGGGSDLEPVFGFEQEYTLFEGRNPLGWPEDGFPRPQGPFYCGVGANRVYGREVSEAHLEACLEAGILIYGTNAEVMPGQWEFQIGYRGFEGEKLDALKIADHHWIATWLLHRIGESAGVTVSFENKPVRGDWNGAGCHTNFSTADMRDKAKGDTAIKAAIDKLSKKHMEHIKVYGYGLDARLTGEHETCHITQFKAGNSDRGASIRVPLSVQEKGYGYIEDRRPGANSDPYLVSARIIVTVAELDESILKGSFGENEEVLTLKTANA